MIAFLNFERSRSEKCGLGVSRHSAQVGEPAQAGGSPKGAIFQESGGFREL